jgi:hypothetical protein
MRLPQDKAEAEWRQNATDADEHHTIYDDHERATADLTSTQQRSPLGCFKQFAGRPAQEQDVAPQGQAPLARYFHSLPARSGIDIRMTPRVKSPSRESLHLPVAGPSRVQPEPRSDNNELSLENLAVANKQGHVSDEQARENREEVLSRGASTDVDQDQSAMQAHDETNFPLVGSEDLLNQEQLRGPEHDRSDSESYVSFDPEYSSLSNEDHNLDEVTAHDFKV